MTGVFAHLHRFAALSLAGIALSGCSLYKTEGSIIASRTEDGPGRAMPFRPGIYCGEATTDTKDGPSEPSCARLIRTSASSYALSTVDSASQLTDDDPFLLHFLARKISRGPLTGWYLAEACQAGDETCVLVAVRAETDEIAYMNLPSCKTGKCTITSLPEAIAAFENETIELDKPAKAIWVRE